MFGCELLEVLALRRTRSQLFGLCFGFLVLAHVNAALFNAHVHQHLPERDAWLGLEIVWAALVIGSAPPLR